MFQSDGERKKAAWKRMRHFTPWYTIAGGKFRHTIGVVLTEENLRAISCLKRCADGRHWL